MIEDCHFFFGLSPNGFYGLLLFLCSSRASLWRRPLTPLPWPCCWFERRVPPRRGAPPDDELLRV